MMKLRSSKKARQRYNDPLVDGAYVEKDLGIGRRSRSNYRAVEFCLHPIRMCSARTVEKGFQEYRLLLGSEGGRGGQPKSLILDTTLGKKALLLPGGSAKLAEPTVSPVPDIPGQFQIVMSSPSHAGWVAAKICELFPALDMGAVILELTQRASDMAKLKRKRFYSGMCDVRMSKH